MPDRPRFNDGFEELDQEHVDYYRHQWRRDQLAAAGLDPNVDLESVEVNEDCEGCD